MNNETVAQRLAKSISEAAARPDVGDSVLHAAERVLLDSLGCGLGAIHAAPSIAARKWAASINGSPHAHIIGTNETSSVLGAALANCTMIRHLDMNDCDWARDPAHPSDNIGGCLAVAEATGGSTRDLLLAILIAYEVQMRTTEFTKVSFFKKIGWDHTTFVTLASAAAAAVLLKLDQTRIAHAISIAASYPTVGQLRVGQISMMKAMSAGLAVSRGIEAAYLAGYGVTGPLEIFEGKRGISKLFLGDCDWDILAASIDAWRMPRTCLKQYPAAYIIHSAIDAALALKKDHLLQANDIASVEVAGFGWLIEDMVRGMGGKSRYEIDVRETADHSLPYCVAVSLVDGEYSLNQLDVPRWTSEDVKSMLTRVKCVHDASLDSGFPSRRPVRITIQCANGKTLSKEVSFPKGDPRNPLSDADIAGKFRRLSSAVLDDKKQERLIDITLNLHRHDLGELTNACIP